MPRMSKEAQRKMGLDDAAADFDEFLQLDDSNPRAKYLKKKRGIRKSVDGLKRATYYAKMDKAPK